MLKVGIIGAGEGGTSILKTLMSVSGIEVVGICDTNFNAPGIVYAREHNIPVFEDFKKILEIKGKKIVIEVTGNQQLREELKSYADEQSEIISSEVALLISNVVEAREKIIKRLEEESAKLAVLIENLSLSIQEISEASLKNSENLNNTVNKLIKTAEKNQNNLSETHDIVKLIQKVANQTKMLGFNAAIEAHRAGSEGVGFRVVAKEIKELADETGDSVKQISHLIEELNNSTKETFDNIEEMNLQTSKATEVQEKISRTLVNVADNIQDLSRMLKKLTK